MRFILINILFLNYIYADLDSAITSNAQMACFLKNPTNGLSPTDYSPVVIGQTLRQSIESYHTTIQSEATCDSWLLDPYVTVDTETYQVVANMDCSVNSEINEFSETSFWTVENQYALDIDCKESCEIPRDDDGNIYEFTPYINETDCTVSNLQQLVLAEDPNSLYTIVDAQYLNCEINSALTGCFYKKTISFDNNNDDNSTDTNTSDTNTTSLDNNETLSYVDFTATNNLLDDIGFKLDANGLKIDALGTKIDNNGEKIDNLGTKIDSVNDSIIVTGDYLGDKLDIMNNTITNELKFQGDRLHNDLIDLKDLQSEQTDTNGSIVFDDSGIIDALNEIKDLNKGELDADASFLDTYQTYYDDMSQSIQNVENNVNDLMATIQGDYAPQFQIHNSCTINFLIMGRSISVNMCRYAYIIQPFITFILTIYMLILLIRLHFYLFPKVYKSD